MCTTLGGRKFIGYGVRTKISNTGIPEEQAMHLEARIATNIKNLLKSQLGKHLIQYLHFVHAFKCQTYVGEIKFGFSMHYYSIYASKINTKFN